MWLILLDRSGSMGETFSSKSDFIGRSRQSQSSVKLDAAKEALREHLLGLGSPSQIALFEFTSTTSLIFEGMSDDSIGIPQALDTLSAENGTDIAAALTRAFEYTNQVQNVNIFRVLVISDGLSDRESAEWAARRLAGKPSLIDVILIDPTEDGEAVARAIAIGGTVSAVTSAEELARKVTESEQRQAELAKQAEAIMSEYEQAAQSFAAREQREQPEERLSFTAGYPGTILPETWYSFWVYLHLARLQDEVTEKLRQKATKNGFRASISTAESASRLKRGTWLRLTPRVDGVVFNPPSQEVVWYEDIQEISFRLQPEPNVKGLLLGSVEVYSQSLLMALIPLSLNVRQPDVSDEPDQTVTSSAQIFNRIFASYSRKDESIVDACVAAYEALGIYVYIDKKSLRSGELWHLTLQKFIQESDLFQLYWSRDSSKSPNVENEWRYALNLMDAGKKHESFIRPLRWEEEWTEPPIELSPINFARLDLFALERYAGYSLPSSPTKSPTLGQSVTNYPALPVTVVPILPSNSSKTQWRILEDVVYAVNFLEEVTGLRYYPLSTLLVDEFITKSIRAINTIDLDQITQLNNKNDQILYLTDLLQSITVQFHARGFHPESVCIDKETPQGLEFLPGAISIIVGDILSTRHIREESWEGMEPYLDASFGKGKLLRPNQFVFILRACEILRVMVEEYIGIRESRYGKELLKEFLDEITQYSAPNTNSITNQTNFLVQFNIFLNIVSNLLKEGLKNLGDFNVKSIYPIKTESWHLLKQKIPNLKLRRDYSLLEGDFSEFVRVFQIVAAEIVEELGQVTHIRTAIQNFFAIEVPTYGIYVSSNSPDNDDRLKRWAFNQGIATELTLSNTPRVLFCIDAHERFEKKLQQESVESQKSRHLARDFQRSVLVHEHFHAILETGLDARRSPASGPKFEQEWKAVSCLNESLAVWMELHAARENQELIGLIWNYIQADSYPHWPYRGAEKIEEIYQQQGIEAVRELIVSIRNDPETAQSAFNSLFPCK